MHNAHGVLIEEPRVQPPVPAAGPAPRLKLLIELEPRHRAFVRNLGDLLLSRRVPQAFISARPAPFWKDVFVASGPPWASFIESLLGHFLLVILMIWSQSRVWTPVKLFQQQESAHRSITYAPTRQTFHAAEGRASEVRPQLKQALALRTRVRGRAIRVKPERRPGIVAPPDITQATARLPKALANLPGSHSVTPMAPFSAATSPRRNALAGPSEVVAPPPQVDRLASRQLGLPSASVVAPAPDLGGASVGRTIKTAGARVVMPPPTVQNTGGARADRLSALAGAEAGIVPPPPTVPGASNGSGGQTLGAMSGPGALVVPPPPSIEGTGGSSGTGLRGQPSSSGVQVVPPPPGVQIATGLGGGGRPGRGVGSAAGSGVAGTAVGDGSQVIPPPPSVAGTGGSGLAGPVAALSGEGSQVIPPPPSVAGSGGSGLGGRIGSLSPQGSQVVPPPPSVAGAGGSGLGGRVGSLSREGSQIVPPPPSVGGAGGSGAGGRVGSLAGNGSQALPPSSSVAGTGNGSGSNGTGTLEPLPIDPSSAPLPPASPASPATAVKTEIKPTVEELPLGLLGLVFAPPGTSFFSNFEVFVAKRKVGGNQLELIKLVYEFLPYQRRLSEYDLNNQPPRLIKLRVTADPSCNESLGRMMEPHGDPTLPRKKYPELPVELRSSDPNSVLPCYRTNADDFRKAMSRAR